MYSGIILRRGSGRLVGVHQKIDRVARRQIKKLISADEYFPPILKILHFEGLNGPDGIKRKSPSKDEPWHYIDPTDPEDLGLVTLINDHIYNLSHALSSGNEVRAAFEAAWLAHAVVDGLTPAHHYPLDDKIEELWGKSHLERTSIREKTIIKGDGARDTFSKNWQYWGAKGVFTAHIAFEWGVASAITSNRFTSCTPTQSDIKRLKKTGFEAVFLSSVYRINRLGMYEKFASNGWTQRLANQTKNVLIPEIINVVCLAWYQAIQDSKEVGK
jgi:hypothetical protein